MPSPTIGVATTAMSDGSVRSFHILGVEGDMLLVSTGEADSVQWPGMPPWQVRREEFTTVDLHPTATALLIDPGGPIETIGLPVDSGLRARHLAALPDHNPRRVPYRPAAVMWLHGNKAHGLPPTRIL